MCRRRGPRLTRRGHYLLSFGAVQVALGLAGLAASTTSDGRLSQQLLPPAVYAVGSLAAGLLSVLAAFVRPALERAAFTALAVTAAARCLSYVGAWALGEQSGALLTGALAFGLLLRVHLLVAGWPDPPPASAVTLTQEQLELLAEELRRRHRAR